MKLDEVILPNRDRILQIAEHYGARNSMYLDGDVPDEVLKSMLDESYAILLASFSKKAQQEILET